MNVFDGFDGLDDVLSAFEAQDAAIRPRTEADVFVATYYCEGYEGSAFVLFTDGGKLYEANGSHCSCMGLEGQWEPEETNLAAILMRPEGAAIRQVMQAFGQSKVDEARSLLREKQLERGRAGERMIDVEEVDA